MKCSWKRRCGDAEDWVSDEPTGTTPSRDSLLTFGPTEFAAPLRPTPEINLPDDYKPSDFGELVSFFGFPAALSVRIRQSALSHSCGDSL